MRALAQQFDKYWLSENPNDLRGMEVDEMPKRMGSGLLDWGLEGKEFAPSGTTSRIFLRLAN